MATHYVDVPISKARKGDFFASVHRYTFETLLWAVRRGLLTHADVAMWLVLSYKYWRCRGKTEDHHFFITKRELIRLSGIANAPSCVRHLYEVVVFSDGKHLFEWLDWSQRLAFSQWTWSSDPSKNEPTARLQETRRRELAEQVLAQKQLMQERQQSTRRCRLGIRP